MDAPCSGSKRAWWQQTSQQKVEERAVGKIRAASSMDRDRDQEHDGIGVLGPTDAEPPPPHVWARGGVAQALELAALA